ncbi:MAG: hypothetical protein ABL886_08915 [Rhodoglobus sp.]
MSDVSKRPGWYPAPDGTGERWWTGVGWSDAARQPVVYSAQNPAPQDPNAVARFTWGSAVGNTVPGRTINASVNKFAFYGFLCGIISVFFNVLFLLAPLAIVFSIIGLAKARDLKARGAPQTLAGLAAVGLATGALSMAVALIGFVAFAVSSFGTSVG